MVVEYEIQASISPGISFILLPSIVLKNDLESTDVWFTMAFYLIFSVLQLTL